MSEVHALDLNQVAFAIGHKFIPDELSATWVARMITYYLPEVGDIGAQLQFLVNELARALEFKSLQ